MGFKGRSRRGGSGLNRQLTAAIGDEDLAAVAELLATADLIESRDLRGATPLLRALSDYTPGRLPIVELLLDQNANVTAADSSGTDPLMLAAGEPLVDNQLIQQLLDRGADVTARDQQGASALVYGVRKNRLAAVELLLAHGADPNVCTSHGRCPLSIALGAGLYGRSEMADLLERHGAVLVRGTEADTRNLFAAIAGGFDEQLQRLLAAGADPNRANQDGVTPLLIAVGAGNLRAVELLLEHGAANHPDVRGTTPLMIGARKGHLAVVDALLDRGARIEERDQFGNSALHIAMRECRYRMVKHLVERGGDADSRDARGVPLLLAAIPEQVVYGGEYGGYFADRYDIDGRRDLVRWLMARGVDVDAEDSSGRRPLGVALEHGELELAQLLLDAGAEVDHRDPETGRTWLIEFAERGMTDAARVLLGAGAEIDAVAVDGTSALIAAVEHQHVDLVRLLAEVGADITLCRADGVSARSLAAAQADRKIAGLLLESERDG